MEIHFVYGNDEYLVERRARQLIDSFLEKSPQLQLDFINGMLLTKSDFRLFPRQLLEAIQTLPLFGDSKVIWVQSANFFRETIAESEEKQWEELLAILGKNRDENIDLILSASSIDRRLRISKNFEKISTVYRFEGAPENACEAFLLEEMERRKLQFDGNLRRQFLEKVGIDTRCIASEIEKLHIATAARSIHARDIQDLVCEGNFDNFFEPIEAFYGGDREYFQRSLDRYFANNGDVRPLLAAFQNRNRLLIQAKALHQLGLWRRGFRGIPSKIMLDTAKNQLKVAFLAGASKSNCSIFSQNLWYLGRITENLSHFSTEILILLQQKLTALFRQILDHPHRAEIQLKDLLLQTLMGCDSTDKTPKEAGRTALFAESLQKNGYHNY